MCSEDQKKKKKKEGERWTSESHYQLDAGAFSVALLYTTLCNLMDCSLPGSSVCGISQGRILEWVAISLPTGSTWPRDQIQDSHTGLSHQRMGLGQVWDFKLETWKVKVKSLSHVRLFVTLWTVAHQAPPSMGILQARILEWITISFSRGSSWPRDQTQVSHIAGRRFNLWTTREAVETWKTYLKQNWKTDLGVFP